MPGHDVIVIGGGMAGASLAYELAADHAVLLLDMEPTLGFHTTGRSAAMFLESYGGPAIRALTTASRDFLEHPPAERLLTTLPLLHIARLGRGQVLRELHRDVSALVPGVRLLEPGEAAARQPLLRPDRIELAMLEPDAMEIDVHALHQVFVRGLRERGGEVAVSTRATSAVRAGGTWTVVTADARRCRAQVVVDAAGAWADEVGALFGAGRIGLRALRRTVFTVDAPPGTRPPMLADLHDATNRFYLKPDAGRLLCSPADETPQPPGDARADETAIARAIDAINTVTALDVRHVRSSWAGLRNFVADGAPVVGYDPSVEGLFWFAAQGGYGIQIAPALARAGAALVRGGALPADVSDRGLTAAALAPQRAGLARNAAPPSRG